MYAGAEQIYKQQAANRVLEQVWISRRMVSCFALFLVLSVSVVPAMGQASLIGGAPVASMQQEQQRMAAEERQKKMLEDAEKLLQLAQQLKENVDKTNKNTLSVEVIRDAEKVEKLARQVRENMRR